MEIKTKRYWAHFFRYFIIIILISFVFYWAAKDIDNDTKQMLVFNWLSIFKIIFISLSMIYFYNGETLLRNREKFIPILILFILDFAFTFLVNYFNLFDRIITLEDLQEGLGRYLTVYTLVFVLCILISIFIRSKITK